MNEFYFIAPEKQTLEHPYQLPNLGKQRPIMTIGRRESYYWDSPAVASETFYRDTTPEDYDFSFAYKLTSIKPAYDTSAFINYHLSYYVTERKGEKNTFVKHIKYVIAPVIKKQKGKEVYLELITEWIEENGFTEKRNQQLVSIFQTGDINAPTQFQQNHPTIINL